MQTLNDVENCYPTGFFITEDDEIVYSTGKAHEVSLYVMIIRMLENEGLTERPERFDRLQPATREDARRFYDALIKHLEGNIQRHEKAIREYMDVFQTWTRRINELF